MNWKSELEKAFSKKDEQNKEAITRQQTNREFITNFLDTVVSSAFEEIKGLLSPHRTDIMISPNSENDSIISKSITISVPNRTEFDYKIESRVVDSTAAPTIHVVIISTEEGKYLNSVDEHILPIPINQQNIVDDFMNSYVKVIQ